MNKYFNLVSYYDAIELEITAEYYNDLGFIINLNELDKKYDFYIQKMKNNEDYNKNIEEKYNKEFNKLAERFGTIPGDANHFSFKPIFLNRKKENFPFYKVSLKKYNYIFSKDVSEEEHLDRLNYLKVIVEDELFINIKDINFLENMDFNTFLKFDFSFISRQRYISSLYFSFYPNKICYSKISNYIVTKALYRNDNFRLYDFNFYNDHVTDHLSSIENQEKSFATQIEPFIINFSTRDHQFNSIFRLNIDNMDDFNKLVGKYQAYSFNFIFIFLCKKFDEYTPVFCTEDPDYGNKGFFEYPDRLLNKKKIISSLYGPGSPRNSSVLVMNNKNILNNDLISFYDFRFD